MKSDLTIGLIGDQNPEVAAHRAIPMALQIAARKLDTKLNHCWLPTMDIHRWIHADSISDYDGFWCVPASPYEDTAGALTAIKIARENSLPTLGTCGGFQHMAIEFAQNELGFRKADNAEINPETSMPLVAPLSCALIEVEGNITFNPNSKIANIYQQTSTKEKYHCSFGLNGDYQHIFEGSPIDICGMDENDDPRALEHNSHPFFIGVAFQPERSALEEFDHPLVSAFVTAALNHSTAK